MKVEKQQITKEEKELFIVAAAMGIEMLSEINIDGYTPNIDLETKRWDNLYWHQQVCAIGQVANDLLNSKQSTYPFFSEWSRLTIASIYDFIIYSSPLDFELYIVAAAQSAKINIKPNHNLPSKLDSVLRKLRDRIIGPKLSKKKIAEQFGDSYYSESFPAFSIDKFEKAYDLLNKENKSFAFSRLPNSIQKRIQNGFEEETRISYKPWYPIYSKQEIIFCWK